MFTSYSIPYRNAPKYLYIKFGALIGANPSFHRFKFEPLNI